MRERRMKATRRVRKLVSVIAAGTVLMLTAPAFGGDGRDSDLSADFDVYVKRGERVWRHRKGDPLLPGDTVRLLPKAPKGYGYVMGLWQGKSGEVEVIFPWRGERSGALPPPGEMAKGAAVLDAQLGPEAILAIYSVESLLAVDVAAWADDVGAFPPSGSYKIGGKGVEVVVLRFEKVTPRR